VIKVGLVGPKNYGVKQIVTNEISNYRHNNYLVLPLVAILNPRDDLKDISFMFFFAIILFLLLKYHVNAIPWYAPA
jgi:hypothetical protein